MRCPLCDSEPFDLDDVDLGNAVWAVLANKDVSEILNVLRAVVSRLEQEEDDA